MSSRKKPIISPQAVTDAAETAVLIDAIVRLQRPNAASFKYLSLRGLAEEAIGRPLSEGVGHTSSNARVILLTMMAEGFDLSLRRGDEAFSDYMRRLTRLVSAAQDRESKQR